LEPCAALRELHQLLEVVLPKALTPGRLMGQLPGLILKQGVLVLALEQQLRELIPEQRLPELAHERWLPELILEQVR